MAVATKFLDLELDWGTLNGHASTVTVNWITVWTASTGGTMIAWAATADPLAIAVGTPVRFPANSIKFRQTSSSTGGPGDAYAKEILDMKFGSGSPATLYYAMHSGLPASDGTGGTEFPTTGAVYARKAVTNNTTNHPAATMV
jgi:hypothetical protein